MGTSATPTADYKSTPDYQAITAIRTLSMDAVQQANSGHPGTPIALAPVAYCLWQRFLRFDPADPIWPNRDRFVLSAGHASMLLYSMLHLTRVQAVNKKYENVGQPSVPLDDGLRRTVAFYRQHFNQYVTADPQPPSRWKPYVVTAGSARRRRSSAWRRRRPWRP